MGDFVLLSGSAHPGLGASVAHVMKVRLGACAIDDRSDRDPRVHLYEDVRNKDVFIIQPAPPPVNEYLVELIALANAASRARARRVIAVVPYFGYTRSDQGTAVTRILRSCGIDQVLTLDPHLMEETLARAVRRTIGSDCVVVSPHDKAQRLAQCLGEILALPVVAIRGTHVIGDPADRPILLADDVLATGTTMVRAVETLIGAGARLDFTLVATHGLLLHEARENLDLPLIRQIIVTDSVAPQVIWPRLNIVTIAPLIANAIDRTVRFRPLAAA